MVATNRIAASAPSDIDSDCVSSPVPRSTSGVSGGTLTVGEEVELMILVGEEVTGEAVSGDVVNGAWEGL